MKEVSIIVAYSENRVIGYNNNIPWHIPEDWKLFKEKTTGHTVVMGRKTFDSLPKKPLPNRTNIVVTRNKELNYDDVIFASSIEDAIEKSPTNRIFIIGGGQIYQDAIDKNLVNSIVASIVYGEYKGDTYFPALDKNWKVKNETNYDKFKVIEFEKN